MAIKPVKFYNSLMTGAPQLSGQAGKLTDILKACLVDGFNQKTLTSLSVTGGVLNGALTAHGYSVDQVISVSGANESALNTQWTITSATANAFTADATGVGNVTGTGTIVAIVAPAGWTTMSTTTNVRAFKSSDNDSNGHWLRVDDTTTTYATVRGHVTMTDGDTGTEAFPAIGTGLYWWKSSAADASARKWIIVADGKTLYVQIQNYTNPYNNIFVFGGFVSTVPGDVFNTVITGANTTTQSYTYNILSSSSEKSATQVGYFPKAWTRVGAPVSVSVVQHQLLGRSGSWAAGYYYATPTPDKNDFLFTSAGLYQSGFNAPMCDALPGLYGTPMVYTGDNLTIIPTIIGLENRRLVAVRCDCANSGGMVYFDITGPWQ